LHVRSLFIVDVARAGAFYLAQLFRAGNTTALHSSLPSAPLPPSNNVKNKLRAMVAIGSLTTMAVSYLAHWPEHRRQFGSFGNQCRPDGCSGTSKISSRGKEQ
jgi:hypothetical protein